MWVEFVGSPLFSNLRGFSKLCPVFLIFLYWSIVKRAFVHAVTKRNMIIFSSNALVLKFESKTINWETNSDLEITQTRIWFG